MKVVVLAGGLGTRLGELTHELPKAMVRAGGRPFLEFVVDAFASRGLKDFVFLTGYRTEAIERHFGGGERFGVDIAYSREDKPLGTGGAVREARALLGERFILTYADVLRRFDYDRFVREHERENCLAVYERISVGNTEIDGGRVVRFDKTAPTLPYIDAGFSLMKADVIDMLPPQGACSFEQTVYSRLAERGALACEVVDRNFYDIGTPEELARTCAALESTQ